MSGQAIVCCKSEFASKRSGRGELLMLLQICLHQRSQAEVS